MQPCKVCPSLEICHINSLDDNSRTSPPDLAGFNLVFINVYDEGQAYTELEHQEWLEEAGFGDL